MFRKTILSSLLFLAGVLCVAALADDQSSSQKSGKSDATTRPDQSTPNTGMMGKGLMGKGMMGKGMGGGMMGKGMMGGPMMGRGMKMMELHKKMLAEMKAMEAETDKMVAEMNQASGPKKIDAMAALLTRLVDQRKTMNDKMGTMHAEMMQMMMESMGSGTATESGGSDQNGTAHDPLSAGDSSEHAQHQH